MGSNSSGAWRNWSCTMLAMAALMGCWVEMACCQKAMRGARLSWQVNGKVIAWKSWAKRESNDMREVCCMLFSPSQYDCRALRLSEKLRPPQKNVGIIAKSHTPSEEDHGALPDGMSLQCPVRTGYVAF